MKLRRRILLTLLLVAVGLDSLILAEETRLAVKHDHLFGSCEGQLIFTESGVDYQTNKADHARHWRYEDIQQIGLEPKKIEILTYHDRALLLGKDQRFEFGVTEGQVPDSLRTYLETRLARPVVSSVLPPEAQPRHRIPVRHRKTVSGTEGALELYDTYLVYRTSETRDSRVWRYDDLLSIGSTGPYQLRITALERTGGEYGDGKNFVFDLKARLSEQIYDFLWNKVNRPRIDR